MTVLSLARRGLIVVSNTFQDRIRGQSALLGAALSRLDGLVNWERRARSGGRAPRMRVSLAPARDLCERLGSPEGAFRAVHVAGSKGKGSVSSLVAAGLRRSGVREGFYSSPHVERVQERLALGGVPVDDDVLALARERALSAREAALAEGSPAREATWFDVLTAAAFLVLAEAEVEMAVVECGLGGRLDSTNVVQGEVCAITNIYLEHTAILGSTRTAIAGEKAGIIKPGSVVVAGALGAEDEATRVIEGVARERGARLLRLEFAERESMDERNLRLAGAILDRCAEVLPGRGIGAKCLDPATRELARLPGRAERRWHGETRVVLDGAHVPESLALLLHDLAADPELALPPSIVIGMGHEKDARGLLKALRGRVDTVLCTSVGDGPYRDPMELRALAAEIGLSAEGMASPRAALEEAVRRAGSGWVLVTGSLHLVGVLRELTAAS